MLLLISDANILIDMVDGNLVPIIFQLPYEIAVPDILFDSELSEVHSHLLEVGLKLKSLNPESIKKAEFLIQRYPRPGKMDHFALALALQEQCLLLTGDKDLRIAAESERVEVHGTIWIVQELLSQKIISLHQAKGSFDAMKIKERRLPWGVVDEMLNSKSWLE